jgi:hypothetical protein
MPDCPIFSQCTYFDRRVRITKPTLAEILQKRFCFGDHAACARFIVFRALGKELVPLNLDPLLPEEADRIIAVAAGKPVSGGGG